MNHSLIPGYLWISCRAVSKLRIPASVHPKVEFQWVGYSSSLCDYITIFRVPSSKVEASSYQTVKQFFTGNRQFSARSYGYDKSKKQNTWRRFVISSAFIHASISSPAFALSLPALAHIILSLSPPPPFSSSHFLRLFFPSALSLLSLLVSPSFSVTTQPRWCKLTCEI